MTTFLDQAIRDDFVWEAITDEVRGQARNSSSFLNICCPMCVHMGEPTPDTKYRCGIRNNRPGVGIHCFRCGFKTRWCIGDTISGKLRWFMSVIGMDDRRIKRLNLTAVQYRRILGGSQAEGQVVAFTPSFHEMSLPDDTYSIKEWIAADCPHPDFKEVLAYILRRGEEFLERELYWTPTPHNTHEMSRRFIIRAEFNQKTVGWIARSIDPVDDKYRNSIPANYLLNNHLLREEERKSVFLLEGAMDAVAVNGIGTLGARLNDHQIKWLKESGKEIIVVPDSDNAGGRLVEIALKQKWAVSFPVLGKGHPKNLWGGDVKDAAQATEKYGALYTAHTLMEATTRNPTEIQTKLNILRMSK